MGGKGFIHFTAILTLYSFSLFSYKKNIESFYLHYTNGFQWLWARTPLGSFLVHSVTHMCLPV